MNKINYLPSLDEVHRRIGELARELQMLRSLRRILRQHGASEEAAAEMRKIKQRKGNNST